MNREFELESIEYWQDSISEYDKEIAKAKKAIAGLENGSKKRNAFEMVIKTCEMRKAECVRHIQDLMAE